MAFLRCLIENATLSITFLVLIFKCNGQITSNLQDEIKCTGESVTLNWIYTTTNEILATWLFGTSTIMTSVSGGAPTVDNAYTGRATHGGNGVLTLTGLTSTDSGTYTLSVTYGAAPGLVRDSVEVKVYDKISQESTPVCGTNTVTCGSSSLNGVTFSWTVDGAATSDTSWSIPSRDGTKTYACTILGDRVTNCLDAGIAATKSASCTFQESGGLSPCAIAGIIIAVVEIIAALVLAILWWKKLLCFKEPKLRCCDKAGIVIAVLVGVVVIPVVVIVILWKKKLLCFKVPTEKTPTGSTDSGIRSTSPNQVKPSVENSTPMVESSNVTNSKVDTTENSKDPIIDIENKKRHTGVDPITERSEGQPEINKNKPLPSIGQ